MDLRYGLRLENSGLSCIETDSVCRGTRFTLSRDELLTLPEFVLLSLFPNGLFPEGHMGGFADGDAVQVDVGISNLSCNQDLEVVLGKNDESQNCSTPPSKSPEL